MKVINTVSNASLVAN